MSNPTAARFCLFVPIFILIFNTLYVSVSLNSPAAPLQGHPSHSLDRRHLTAQQGAWGVEVFLEFTLFSQGSLENGKKNLSFPAWNFPSFKVSQLPLENSFQAFYPEWINHFSEGGNISCKLRPSRSRGHVFRGKSANFYLCSLTGKIIITIILTIDEFVELFLAIVWYTPILILILQGKKFQ